MIVWIASYPKSGNTWVRALISHYFFSKDKKFSFDLLKHIPNFNVGDFISEKTPLKSNEDIIKNWLPAQRFINQKFKRNLLFKTHNACIKIDENEFTNKEVTAGCIYIVRDPRNVITSYKNFEKQTYENIAKNMFDNKGYLLSNESTLKRFGIKGIEIISSWCENYNSWVHNKHRIPVCLIKYENLSSNPFNEFRKIFEFLKEINKEKITQIDEERLRNTITETSFENLRFLEKKNGFSEKQNRNVSFFNQGKENNWRKVLPEKLLLKINKRFSREMRELGYLY
tara:strand:- start:391 stop:1242 length:852 start_codon:yes stop_codon:yes gene_type:complete